MAGIAALLAKPGVAASEIAVSVPKPATAEQRAAAQVRAAADAFNEAVRRANALGLDISFAISRFTASPARSEIGDITITRPADWNRDDLGEKL